MIPVIVRRRRSAIRFPHMMATNISPMHPRNFGHIGGTGAARLLKKAFKKTARSCWTVCTEERLIRTVLKSMRLHQLTEIRSIKMRTTSKSVASFQAANIQLLMQPNMIVKLQRSRLRIQTAKGMWFATDRFCRMVYRKEPKSRIASKTDMTMKAKAASGTIK